MRPVPSPLGSFSQEWSGPGGHRPHSCALNNTVSPCERSCTKVARGDQMADIEARHVHWLGALRPVMRVHQ